MYESFVELFRDFVFGNGNIVVAILIISSAVVVASRVLRLGKL